MRHLRVVCYGLGFLALVVIVALVARGRQFLIDPNQSPAQITYGVEQNAYPVAKLTEPFDGTIEGQGGERQIIAATTGGLSEVLAFGRDDLYGIILDINTRAPISNATIIVFELGVLGNLLPKHGASLSTDEEGRFRARAIGQFEEFDIVAMAEGYAAKKARLVTGRMHELLMERGLAITGRVLGHRDRKPIAGAEVWLYWKKSDSRSLATERVNTDADGKFFLRNVPCKSNVEIQYALPGSCPTSRSFSTGTESIEDIELVLGAQDELRLRLVDYSSRAALAGFPCEVLSIGSFVTDTGGCITVGYDRENHKFSRGGLLLDIQGQASCRTRILVSQENLAEQHDVPITGGTTIEGVVHDKEGQPIVGASVWLLVEEPFLASPGTTFRDLPPGIVITSREPPFSLTTEQGDFILEHLFVTNPSSHNSRSLLNAVCDGWQMASIAVQIPPTGEKMLSNIMLKPGAEIRGRILERDAPFSGVRVSGHPSDSREDHTCVTNDAGEYVISRLPGGPVYIDVRLANDPGVLLAEDSVTVSPGETIERDITIAGARVPIEGIVRDTSGNPVAGATVFVRGSGLTVVSTGIIRGMGATATSTANDGQFRLLVPNDSRALELVAWNRGVESSETVTPGSDNVEMVLPAQGTLRLSLVDPSEKHVALVDQVRWWPKGTSQDVLFSGYASKVTPTVDGPFDLALPVGEWDLELLIGGRAPAVVAGIEIRADRVIDLTVNLARGTTVELHFTSEGPTEGSNRLILLRTTEKARVEAGDIITDAFIRANWRVKANADGRLVVSGLAPGMYSLDQIPKGWSVEPHTFDVPDLDEYKVSVRWVRSNKGN